MVDDEYILYLFRQGDLVSAEPQPERPKPSDSEILEANKKGLLIGARGFTTLFGSCTECDWQAHVHAEVGDTELEMADFQLEDAHADASAGSCEAIIKIRQKSAD